MRQRFRVQEIMDLPDLDRRSHESALRGLGRINVFSRSLPQIWAPILEAGRAVNRETLRVLDLACGGGDLACGIAHRAKAAGLPLEVHGADLSGQAIAFAASQAQKLGVDVHFFKLDALADRIPQDYDVVTCTLFLHHLGGEDAERLLAKLGASARRMVLVDDLIRSRLGYALAWGGCRLLSRSKVVHHDGPASVAAAFRLDEVRAMAQAAGLSGATIRTHWPERFLLSWSRP